MQEKNNTSKINNFFTHNKKILRLYLSGIAIFIIFAIIILNDKDTSHDSTNKNNSNNATSSNNTITFEYGRYNFFQNNNGTCEALSILLKHSSVEFKDYYKKSDVVSNHQYIMDNNIIESKADSSKKFQIEIIDSTHIKYNDRIYTYDPDYTIPLQAYIDLLTEQDIQSAIEYAKTQYSPTAYTLTDIAFIDDTDQYYECMNDYAPGRAIIIKLSLTGINYPTKKTEFMILMRDDNDSPWYFKSSHTQTSDNNDNITENETTSQAASAKDITNGKYVSYESKEDGSGKFVFSYMYIDDDTLEITKTFENQSTSVYTYTVMDNMIYADNEDSNVKIEIVNSKFLRYENRLYTYHPEPNTDAYLSAITYDDFESALPVAEEYYNNTTIEIGDLLLVANEETFYSITDETTLKEYNPGQIICLETNAIWGGNATASKRYIILVREDGYSAWSVLTEGM